MFSKIWEGRFKSMGNTLGKNFKITSFGESHGKCVGIVIDGCPAGLPLTEKDIQADLDKRKPDREIESTKRAEEDKVDILSGTFHGQTTGAPLCMVVWNSNADSDVYEKTKDLLRPGHADFTAFIKYGGFNDYRGGGRFSGRITAGFVMAGAVARKLLNLTGMEILAYTVEIGGIKAEPVNLADIRRIDKNPVKCGDLKAAEKMLDAILQAKKEGDSLGGVIEAMVLNVPAGLGEPIFDTLEGDIAKALFAIPAVKGVEFGAGFVAAGLKGSQNNDRFVVKRDKISTETNNSGGILGGISDGMPIVVRAAVKPTPSISRKQNTVNISKMGNAELEIQGRHDVCVVPRAVPVVFAMMAVTIVDYALQSRLIPEVIK
jgi:chorismate synthase